MSKTPEQLAAAVEASIPQIEKAIQGYETLIVSDVEGALVQRIFNKGQDEKEQGIGKYKEGYYKRKRAKVGRQVQYVDLEFNGDLRRSIVKGIKADKLVLGFNNTDKAEIAGYLETKYDKPIFAASKNEMQDAIKTGEAYMVQQLTKIVQGWL